MEEGANLYKVTEQKLFAKVNPFLKTHDYLLESSFNGPGFPGSQQELRKTPQERERGRVTPADASSEG